MLLQCNNESLPHTVASGLTLTVKDGVGQSFFSPELRNQHLNVLFYSKSIFKWLEKWVKELVNLVLLWLLNKGDASYPSCDCLQGCHVTWHACQRQMLFVWSNLFFNFQ